MERDLLKSLQKLVDLNRSLIRLLARASSHKEPDSMREEEINLTSPHQHVSDTLLLMMVQVVVKVKAAKLWNEKLKVSADISVVSEIRV